MPKAHPANYCTPEYQIRWCMHNGYIVGCVWLDGVRHSRYPQHRYLMEKHLGYRLPASVAVHHRNEVKTDNRLENLEVMPHGEHRAHHNRLRKGEKRIGRKHNLSDEQRQRLRKHALANRIWEHRKGGSRRTPAPLSLEVRQKLRAIALQNKPWLHRKNVK